MTTSLITGVTGQDGSYLTEILLEKGHNVVGVKRRTSLLATDRIDHLMNHPDFKLVYGNIHDTVSIMKLVNTFKPDEIYNLAAQSHVKVSNEVPEETIDGIALGTMRLFECVKELSPKTKIYQATSSEIFGNSPDRPYKETSRPLPASPYACAKLFAHNLSRNYRVGHKMWITSGILFNHCSPRRGETFVTRKITQAVAKIKLGLQDKLFLGNIDTYRDWGYAKEYCEAMYSMMQHEEGDDFVVATGEAHSVREFVECVFDIAGLGDYKKYVEIDPRLYRPEDVEYLIGDPSKIKRKLGWEAKIKFEELAKMMYLSDYSKTKTENGR